MAVNRIFRLLVTGGGTGGHVFPIIATVNELKKSLVNINSEIYFLGPGDFGTENLKQEGINTIIIPAGKIPRYPTLSIFIEVAKMVLSVFLSLWHVWRIMPDVIFSKGGFGGFGPVFAAWLFRIPILIHESDSMPGLANRICARFAKKIAISFPDENYIFPKNKVVLTGNPIRSEFFNISTGNDNVPSSGRRMCIFILGGSQGSQEINSVVLDMLPKLLKEADIIHQCGEKNFKELSIESKLVLEECPEFADYYHLRPFLNVQDMLASFKQSDLIISRSGAGSIFEIAAAGKPSILLPLESSAGGHQLKNAEIYSKTGAAIMLIGENAKAHLMFESIRSLLKDPDRLKEMSKYAHNFSRPQAAKLLSEEIINLSGIKIIIETKETIKEKSFIKPSVKNTYEPPVLSKDHTVKKTSAPVKQSPMPVKETFKPIKEMPSIINDIQTIRVRYAPSPTGMMHVGNFRTALYNYLFARKNNGVFYVRMEDTDQTRFVEGGMENILSTLSAMGIEHDEGPFLKNGGIIQKGDFGPYIQSQRLDIYRTWAEELVKNGQAYLCFCAEERLVKVREEQEKNKVPTGYDRLCRGLTFMDAEKKKNEGIPYVIRFKMPSEGETEFIDVIRGEVKFKNELMDDYILLKSDGFPTYHLASVIDDHLMRTSHVIRGEEWLSSAPKHILLYRAFNWLVPQFIHLPLLLNSDRSKLSKRQGDVMVEEYLRLGYFPEAILNFVALLGWNPGTEQEIFSEKELIEQFSLERINKSGAVFDIAKLDWLNKLYINNPDKRWLTGKNKDPLAEKIRKTIELREIIVKDINSTIAAIEQRLNSPTELIKILDTEFKFLPQRNADGSEQFLEYPKELLMWKKMKDAEELKFYLNKALEILSNIQEESWSTDAERTLLFEAEKSGDKGMLLWPVRVALSGQKNSPGPGEIIKILGKEETLKRVKNALDKI